MDKSNVFIKNTDMQSAKYTASKHKKIARLLEKEVFKVVNIDNIPRNIQIFNSYFVDEI